MSMTTEEINGIIGMALERLKQVRKELACLDVKAEYMAKDIETVANVLRGKIKAVRMGGYYLVDPSKGPKQIDWPTAQNLDDILIEREKLTQEITNLEAKTKQMTHDN